MHASTFVLRDSKKSGTRGAPLAPQPRHNKNTKEEKPPMTTVTTTPIDLERVTQNELQTLVYVNYLARKWGAVPGMALNKYWALTAAGEQLFHLV